MRYLVAGDVHANTRWFTNVVEPLAAELRADAIIAVGDFGYWGTVDGELFIERVSNSPVPVYFCDGNHEDHLLLAADVDAARQRHTIDDQCLPVPLGGALWYLDRGSRLEADGVRIVAVGGAASIDRAARQVGISWFVEERITDYDVERAAQGGGADVLICHDAPAGWPIPGIDGSGLSMAWRNELPVCWEQRRQLRRVHDAVAANVVIHGHYHTAYHQTIDEVWGPVDVVGLGCDGDPAAFCVLDCVDGYASVRPVTVALR